MFDSSFIFNQAADAAWDSEPYSRDDLRVARQLGSLFELADVSLDLARLSPQLESFLRSLAEFTENFGVGDFDTDDVRAIAFRHLDAFEKASRHHGGRNEDGECACDCAECEALIGAYDLCRWISGENDFEIERHNLSPFLRFAELIDARERYGNVQMAWEYKREQIALAYGADEFMGLRDIEALCARSA